MAALAQLCRLSPLASRAGVLVVRRRALPITRACHSGAGQEGYRSSTYAYIGVTATVAVALNLSQSAPPKHAPHHHDASADEVADEVVTPQTVATATAEPASPTAQGEHGAPVTRDMMAISSDGKSVAYVTRMADTPPNSEMTWLTLLDTEGPGPRMRTVPLPAGARPRELQYAMDGSLLYKLHTPSGTAHLHAVVAERRDAVDLTPYKAADVRRVMLEPSIPDEVLLEMATHEGAPFDLYRLSLRDGVLQYDTPAPGAVTQWVVDDRLQAIAALVDGQLWCRERLPAARKGNADFMATCHRLGLPLPGVDKAAPIGFSDWKAVPLPKEQGTLHYARWSEVLGQVLVTMRTASGDVLFGVRNV